MWTVDKTLFMQQYKIDNHIREHEDNKFPEFHVLGISECSKILNDISICLLNKEYSNSLFEELIERLDSTSYTEDQIDNISALNKKYKFNNTGSIFIVWNENEIDKMSISDVEKYWSDLWYPSSDDFVILYQKETGKVLLITHNYLVYHN